MAIMVKQARQVPQVIKEFLDQINLPPLPQRLRALLPPCSLLSLLKLRRLLRRRLLPLLQLLLNRQATHRVRRVSLAVREAKETLGNVAPQDIQVLVDTLERAVLQAAQAQVAPQV